MTDVARRFRFTYNGQTIGGAVSGTTSGECRLTDLHRVRVDAESFEVELDFVVSTDTSDADWALTVETLHDTLIEPFADFRMDLLSEATGLVSATPLDLRASAYKATNVRTELSKPGSDEHDAAWSQLWRLRVFGGKPADYGSRAGAREFRYDLRWDASRVLTAVFEGVYTYVAGSSTSAKDQYETAVGARVTSVRTALGVEWELVDEQTTYPNEEDDELAFRREYREVHFNQSNGQLDHPALKDPTLTVSVTTPGTDGDADARPLQRLVATYEAAVDKDQTTDLDGLWRQTVYPWVVQNMRDAVGESLGIEVASFDLDPYRSVLRGRVEALCSGGAGLISRTVVTDDDYTPGAIIRYVWPAADGPPPDWTAGEGHVYYGSPVMRRTITTRSEYLGAVAPPTVGGGRAGGQIGAFGIFMGPNAIRDAQAAINLAGSAANDLANDPSFRRAGGQDPNSPAGTEAEGGAGAPVAVLTNKRRSTDPRAKGLPGDQLDVTVVVAVDTLEFVTPVQRNGAGDGGDVGQTRERTRR